MKSKSLYVDGFVLVVPKKHVKTYEKMAIDTAKIYIKAGALDYKECMSDDLPTLLGGAKIQSFKTLVKSKSTDTIWFSYITFKSRAHRDSVNKKVNKEMEKAFANQKDFVMPFDMTKMSYGGFKVIVSS